MMKKKLSRSISTLRLWFILGVSVFGVLLILSHMKLPSSYESKLFSLVPSGGWKKIGFPIGDDSLVVSVLLDSVLEGTSLPGVGSVDQYGSSFFALPVKGKGGFDFDGYERRIGVLIWASRGRYYVGYPDSNGDVWVADTKSDRRAIKLIEKAWSLVQW